MPHKCATLEERFWVKVDKDGPGGCWLWLGGKTLTGYGQIHPGKSVPGPKKLMAHRVAYELLVCKIPKGLEIDHVCHNRGCVNPLHLRICTRADNIRNSVLRNANTSGYKGVGWFKKTNKWVAYIKHNNKTINLGYYNSPELAHQAYCEAATRLFGEFANFGGNK